MTLAHKFPESASAQEVLAALGRIVGAANLLTGEADITLYSQDVYRSGARVLGVCRPGNIEELAAAVKACTGAGVAVIARGGGMSYTDGYLAVTPNTVLIDMSRMARVLSINEEDMTVTVECGISWAAVSQAVGERGYRTPFYGPFSGLQASVGGSLTQNAVSFGSGVNGPASDNVLSLEVVLADGSVLKTGSLAGANGSAFSRHYGPDLTGLFCADAGALGIKAHATLPLIKKPAVVMAASYGFNSFESLLKGMRAVAVENVADNFAFDPNLIQNQLGVSNMKRDLKAWFAVGKAAGGPLKGAREMARIAIAGKRFIKNDLFTAHFSVEGVDNAMAFSALNAVRRAADPFGEEIANSLPTIVRAYPYQPNNVVLGPKGQRWATLHGLMPFSRANGFHKDVTAYYARRAAEMKEHKVTYAAMFETVKTTSFLYETAFYWDDVARELHNKTVDPAVRASQPVYADNPQGRALVEQIKQDIIKIYQSHGATHYQIGKLYPYMKGRDSLAAALIRDIKKSVDPSNLMNPGALGL
jgi:FAD/FMN-containing dehydrogenase